MDYIPDIFRPLPAQSYVQVHEIMNVNVSGVTSGELGKEPSLSLTLAGLHCARSVHVCLLAVTYHIFKANIFQIQ